MTLPDNFVGWLARSVFLVGMVIRFAIGPGTCHGQQNAILRLRPDGPAAPIQVLQFSADGSKLYAAGDEKLIQVWQIKDKDNGNFERAHSESLRQMIGPGPLGKIAAMSVSDDGRYVVAGGVGTFEDHAGFSADGIMIPSVAWSREVLDELGTVSLFDTQKKTTFRIKTHPGEVIAAVVVSQPGLKQPYLVTIGNDRQPGDCSNAASADNVVRSLRVISIPEGILLPGCEWSLPISSNPKLTVWTSSGAQDVSGLRIAVTVADLKGGGVDLFTPRNSKPNRILNPFALAVDRAGKSDDLVFASRLGIGIAKNFDPHKVESIDLRQRLHDRDVIFSLAYVPNKRPLVAIDVRNIPKPDPQVPARPLDTPHRLQLVDTNQKQLLLPKGIELGNRQNPIIAADPTGRFIAATADVARGIQIFKVADLVAGKILPFQVLQPDFQQISRANLLTINDSRVLRFETQNQDGIETYDFSNDLLRQNKTDRLKPSNQQIVFRQIATGEYVADLANGMESKIKIEASTSNPPIGKQIKCEQLGGKTLVAVAYLERRGLSQIMLSLFDPTTGIEYRRFNGHQQVITSIEFSEDQQHLTTVSADGMVCVWSLSDLNDLVDKRSSIRGVEWCFQNDKPTVIEIETPRGPDDLRIGDQVLGLVDVNDTDRIEEFETLDKLLVALSDYAPSDTALLSVQRDGKNQRVKVQLEQATDERKPLFSFISRANDKVNGLDWLAWTPSGPFQSSGKAIEQRAGWHFNPNDQNPNARFAPLAQYREDFYGDSLVDELLAAGRVPDIWPPLLQAELGACLIDADENSVFPQGILFQPEKDLKEIRVSVSGVPPRYVSNVSARIDHGQALVLKRSRIDPAIWVHDLADPIDPAVALDLAVRHTITVSAKSKRVRNDVITRSWATVPVKPVVVAPPVAQPAEINITSHPAVTQKKLADLDPGDTVQLEAIVDVDQIPTGWNLFFIRNDGAAAKPAEVEISGNHITALIPVQLGSNQLALQLQNSGQVVTSPTVMIDVTEPPEIAAIITEVDPLNIGRAELQVRANEQPKADDLHLLLAGVKLDPGQYQIAINQPNPQQSNLYSVILDSIPLAVGSNRIEVQLLDQQGDVVSRQDSIMQGKAQPRQPELRLLLSDGDVYDSEQLKFSVDVTSEDLEKITCHVEGNLETVWLPQNNQETTEVALEVALEPGENQIVVSAISKAGLKATKSVTVTRLQPPIAELKVTEFKPDDPQNKSIPFEVEYGSYKLLHAAPSTTVN